MDITRNDYKILLMLGKVMVFGISGLVIMYHYLGLNMISVVDSICFIMFAVSNIYDNDDQNTNVIQLGLLPMN
jgi:uncharacterized membrane protein